MRRCQLYGCEEEARYMLSVAQCFGNKRASFGVRVCKRHYWGLLNERHGQISTLLKSAST